MIYILGGGDVGTAFVISQEDVLTRLSDSGSDKVFILRFS